MPSKIHIGTQWLLKWQNIAVPDPQPNLPLLIASARPWSFFYAMLLFNGISFVYLVDLRNFKFSWHFELKNYLNQKLLFQIPYMPLQMAFWTASFPLAKVRKKNGREWTGADQLSRSQHVFCKSPTHSRAFWVSNWALLASTFFFVGLGRNPGDHFQFDPVDDFGTKHSWYGG